MRTILIAFWFSEYTIHLANALSRSIEVNLFLPAVFAEKYKNEIDNKVKLSVFKCPRLRNPASLLMLISIYMNIRKIMPDIIHIQDGHPWFNMMLPLISRQYRVITTIHDVVCHVGDTASARFPFRSLPARFSSRIIVHGEYLKNSLVERYKINPDRVDSIPHGALSVYTRFAKADVKEQNGDDKIVLFFGRIWEYKGLRYLIEAEPLITKKIPCFKIVVAGTGENIQKYKKLMVNKDKFVILNHYIDNTMVAELFQKASVVVLPYIEASQSGVIPIAYSFKKPVVATRVGSIPDVVIDGRTGFLVPPKDTKSLANAIIKILYDDQLRIEMGNNAYKMTMTDLSWENIAAKTIQAYDKTIQKVR